MGRKKKVEEAETKRNTPRVSLDNTAAKFEQEIEKPADLVMLESNHDVNMLQCGGYPYILKRRILGEKGHLSNDDCAKTLARLIKTGTTRFFLGHLSRENNIPQLAYQTSVCALSMEGAQEDDDYFIRVAKPVWDEKAMIL